MDPSANPPPEPSPEAAPRSEGPGGGAAGAIRRGLLMGVGLLCLGLGVLGVILPLLPTTPLILVASACFAGASPTLHGRLAQSRLFGPMLQTGPGGRSLPLRTKVGVLGFLWTSIGSTIVFAVEAPWLRLSLLGVALAVTVVLVRIPTTARRPGSAESR